MSDRIKQSLWGGLVVVSFMLTLAPPAVALSDDSAVQLLERLNELEEEVNNLKGENERLRDRLQGVQTRQEELEQANRLPPEVRTGTDATIPELDVNVNSLMPAETQPDYVPPPTEAVVTPLPRILEEPTRVERVNTANVPPVVEPVREAAPAAVVSNRSTRSESASTANNTSVNPRPRGADSYYYYGSSDPGKADQQPANETRANTGTGANTQRANPPIAPVSASANQHLPANQKIKAEYNEAYKQLVNNPAAAVPAFRTFLASYPQHELAGNAQYWLGEALYAQKDYENATKEFLKVLREYKDSSKASGAALKLGYSYYELKQWEFARRTLEDTVRFFPDSNAAQLAKARLQRMKAENR